MKKNLLSLATLVAVSALSMAADCLGNDSNIVTCTSDEDCVDTDQICDVANETCVTPVCADATDCDLANPDSPTEATVCAADSDCDAGTLCVTDGVGETYCALADEDVAGGACADADATFVGVTVDGKDVCVVDSGESCDDAGQCVAG